MKARALIACITILAAFAFLAACQPDGLAETDSCMECHSGDTTEGSAVRTAQAQYDESGHLNGPRMLSAYTGDHMYVFHGSNASYANGPDCSKCHTHQGFVDFIDAGMPATWSQYDGPPGPECFTCHKPHISGDFSLRKETNETLIDGSTIFNGGKGNLCVTCHKSLTASTTFLTGFSGVLPAGTASKSWQTYNGTHHGPQAEFVMGANYYATPAKLYEGPSPHYSGALPVGDTCVGCHMYAPSDTSRFSGTLQMGGHGMYLGGDVHGVDSNVIGACRSCHTSYPNDFSGLPYQVYANTNTAGGTGSLSGGFEANSSLNARLDDIRANRDLLIGYFGTGSNFYKTALVAGNVVAGVAGDGPIEDALTGGDVASGEWGKDWIFAASRLDENQSKAFWNFKFFIEDKSQGIHNPKFAHQILYDAVVALGMTPAGTPPPNRP